MTRSGDARLEEVGWIDFEALAREHSKPVTDAIPTPLPTWNWSCRDDGGGIGIAPGWFVVLAGKPGAGKSIAAINMIVSAMRHGAQVACLSLEMSKSQLLTRALAVASGCDVQRLERGTAFDKTTLAEAARIWTESLKGKLVLCARPQRTVNDTVSLLKEAAGEDHDCRLVIVDYVQLIGRRDHPNIFERTQMVSGVLQQFAFDERVAVVALSQFNRTTLSARKDEPGPEGLKGGSLDEDADQVVMLDYSDFNRTVTGATTNVVIGKNRHGPTAKVPVRWDYTNLTIREVSSLDHAQERIRSTTQASNGAAA